MQKNDNNVFNWAGRDGRAIDANSCNGQDVGNEIWHCSDNRNQAKRWQMKDSGVPITDETESSVTGDSDPHARFACSAGTELDWDGCRALAIQNGGSGPREGGHPWTDRPAGCWKEYSGNFYSFNTNSDHTQICQAGVDGRPDTDWDDEGECELFFLGCSTGLATAPIGAAQALGPVPCVI